MTARLPDAIAWHPVWIETLDAAGRLLQRQRFDTLPIRIGASYQHDVIVDDAAQRPDAALTLTRDSGGQLLANNVGLTAVVIDGTPLPTDSSRLIQHATLQVGRRIWRVVDAGVSPAPGKASTRPPVSRGSAGSWVGLALPAALGLGLAMTATWTRQVSPAPWWQLLAAQTSLLPGVGAWVASWALISRLAVGQSHWRQHGRIAAWGLLVFGGVSLLGEPLAGALGVPLPGVVTRLSPTVLAGGLAAIHLRHAVGAPGRRLALGLGAAVGAPLLVLLGSLDEVLAVHRVPQAAPFVPPALQWPSNPQLSIDDAMRALAQSHEPADRARQQPVPHAYR